MANNRINRHILSITILFIFVFLFFFAYGLGKYIESKNNKVVHTDTIIEIKHDTIKIIKPTERIKYIYRTIIDTLYTIDSVPVSVNIPIENSLFSDTIIRNSDTVSYFAFVSGYKASLDSIDFNYSVKETIITNTIEDKKWRFGISAGIFAGYDASHKNIAAGPGIMIGIQKKF